MEVTRVLFRVACYDVLMLRVELDGIFVLEVGNGRRA